MTAPRSVDPFRLLREQLESASPDVLRAIGQGVAARNVLRLAVAGPGCDLSEEAAVGIGPSALGCGVAPTCLATSRRR